MERLDTASYLAKHRSSGEFPDEGPFSRLPLPSDAISRVIDPSEWICFPEQIVRIYLSSIEYIHIIGVGDYRYPTVYTKAFTSLDAACFWIANRPEPLSRAWLEQQGFDFINLKPVPMRHLDRMRYELFELLDIRRFRHWLATKPANTIVSRGGYVCNKCPIERYLEENGLCNLDVCRASENILSGRRQEWGGSVDINLMDTHLRQEMGWVAHFVRMIWWYEHLPDARAVETGILDTQLQATGLRYISAREALLCLDFIERWLNRGDRPLSDI